MEEEDAAADPYLPYDGGGDAIPLQEISGRGTPYALLLLNSPHLCKRGRSQKHMADIYVEPTLLLLLLFFSVYGLKSSMCVSGATDNTAFSVSLLVCVFQLHFLSFVDD